MNPATLILNAVAAHYRLHPEDLLLRSRLPEICRPRQLAMYLMHEAAGLSYTQIAKLLSLHHSTAVYAVYKIRQQTARDEALQARLEQIVAPLRPQLAVCAKARTRELTAVKLERLARAAHEFRVTKYSFPAKGPHLLVKPEQLDMLLADFGRHVNARV